MLRIVDTTKMSRTDYIILLANQNWDNQDWWNTALEAKEYLRWEEQADGQADEIRQEKEQVALEEMWHEQRRMVYNFEAFKANKVK